MQILNIFLLSLGLWGSPLLPQHAPLAPTEMQTPPKAKVDLLCRSWKLDLGYYHKTLMAELKKATTDEQVIKEQSEKYSTMLSGIEFDFKTNGSLIIYSPAKNEGDWSMDESGKYLFLRDETKALQKFEIKELSNSRLYIQQINDDGQIMPDSWFMLVPK